MTSTSMMMEPIPEDETVTSSVTIECNHENDQQHNEEEEEEEEEEDENDDNPHQKESKSVRREIYRSEKVESSKRTVPEEKILSMADRYFDPNELGPPEMSSTSYNYSYESTFEKQPENEEVNGEFNLESENGFVVVQQEINGEQMNVERQQKQTQKVTRTTKVTTTRTVQHIPVDHEGSMGNVEYHIISPTHEHETNSIHYPIGPPEEEPHHNRRLVEQQHHHHTSSTRTDAPSQPGMPQIVDVDSDCVTLVWLRPDRNGDAGALHGYQIQYRRVGESHWHVANTEIVTEPLYTIRSLHKNGEYELRIVAKNVAGFGDPSPVSVVHLRPNTNKIDYVKISNETVKQPNDITQPNDNTRRSTNTRRWTGGGHHGGGPDPPNQTQIIDVEVDKIEYVKISNETDVPSSPGRPRVIDCDGASVTLMWEPPIANGRGGPVAGYRVEYRVIRTHTWISATDYLVKETRYTVTGLRPNGDYEFRVSAKNADGFSPPSQSSGEIHVKQPNDITQPNDNTRRSTNTRRWTGGGHHGGGPDPPSQTQIIDVEVDKIEYVKIPNETDVPSSPGRPRVIDCDGTSVTLMWEPPIANGRGGPVAGYRVEYRVIRTHTWISATDYLVKETRYTVTGLRPNGDYEFRVSAKNADGFSPPSQSSGEIHVKQPNDSTQRSTNTRRSIGGGYREGGPDPPSQPQITDVDVDMVTLFWAPPPSKNKQEHSDQQIQDMQYILEHREIGDPNWYSATDRPIWGTQFTIGNLHRNSTYEFRVFARNRHGVSEPSEVSELCQLRPKFTTNGGGNRSVPTQPNPPELMEVDDDCVTLCWAPVRSTVPLQGYQLEFRDLAHPPHNWLPVNNILSHSCKMTVGDLTPNGEYEFRVIAKNAIGYSKPSEPSERIAVAVKSPTLVDGFSSDAVPLPVEIDTTKESPPITDTDDSPPPIRRKHDGRVRYRDPTLPEVLDYLTSSNKVLKLNASGYLQHLTFNHDANKNKVRELDGIPRVIELLRSDEVPEIQRNASGCLRNLSFGNDENKKAILNAGGVPALGTLLKKTPDMQVIEEISSVLWNLSSHDDLKMPVLQHAVDALIKQIVIPYSGWSATGRFTDFKSHPLSAFRNSTGVLRNISSANTSARQTLRDREGLMDSLVHYLHMACDCGDVDTKSVENVICVLRNLCYRLQEIDDPNYDKKPPSHERSKSAPSSSPKAVKKKNKSSNSKKKNDENNEPNEKSPLFKQPATGIALVWQPEVVRDYLKLLDQSTNPDTLEGSAGTIQNLSACYWQPSVEIRATVRKEKGLPVLVQLLSVDNDKVVCASATALRNLSLDPKNKELIGKYAMEDLVKKLPTGNVSTPRSATYVSDDTVASILSVIYATTVRNPEFARVLLEKGGVERLVFLSGSRQYSQRVSKYSSQVLYAIWQHKELHDHYKKAGFREEDFVARVSGGRGQADTLARPISTQGIEGGGPKSRVRPDWGDDYSSRSRAPSAMNVAQQDNGGGSRTPPTPQARTPLNGQQTPHSTVSEPTYSQVQKKNRQQLSVSAQSPGYTNGARSPMAQPQQQQALDSWV